MTKQEITGCILAGGRGLRMGGADKGLMTWQDKPLVQHMLDRLVPQVGTVLVVANRNLDYYQALGHTVLSDTRRGFLGPIAGIATALPACKTPWLVTVPCDTPGFPADLVERLANALEQSDADVAVTHDGEQRQYLFSMYRQSLADVAEAALESGERAIWRWHEKLKVVEVMFTDASAQFANFNSTRDIR